MSLDSELVKQINSLQKQVDALVKPENSRWITWTPTVTQGVAVTTTINNARYTKIGNTAIVMARITVTSAGTAGQIITIGGQPTTIQPVDTGQTVIGTAQVLDTGTQFYVGCLVADTATGWLIRINGANSSLGANPAFTLANGDVISFEANFEV